MITDRETRMLRIVATLAERAGNPNHDELGHFTGPGGHTGKRPKKKRRPKEGQRAKIESVRQRLHARAEKMRVRHYRDKAKVHQAHRIRVSEIKGGMRRKHNAFVKAPARQKVRDVAAKHHEEKQQLRDKIAKRGEEYSSAAANGEHGKLKELKATEGKWREDMHAENKAMHARHKEEKATAVASHAKEVAEGKERIKAHASAEIKATTSWRDSELGSLKDKHAAEKDKFREHVGKMLDKAVGQPTKPKPEKPAAKHDDLLIDDEGPIVHKHKPISHDDDDMADFFKRSVPRKLVLGKGRTHKAGSAESILTHCLRQLGYTKRYRLGTLTGKQTLKLIEAIREYSRAWLRHEAEAFARHYLGWSEQRGILDVAAGQFGGIDSGIDGAPGMAYMEQSRAFEPYNPSAATKAFAGHVKRFFGRCKSFVRESIIAGALAILGPAPLTGEELDVAEQEAQRQAQFFDAFQAEVIANPPIMRPEKVTQINVEPPPVKVSDITIFTPPMPKIQPTAFLPNLVSQVNVSPAPMTPGQFIARAESYGASVHGAAQNTGRAVVKKQAQKIQIEIEEKAVHVGDDEPCETCSDRVMQGENPLGALRPIMDSECRCNCHCHYEFRVAPDGPWHINFLSLRKALDAGHK